MSTADQQSKRSAAPHGKSDKGLPAGHEHTQSERNRLSRLLELFDEIGSALVSKTDAEELAQSVIPIATRLCRAQFGVFLFTDPNAPGAFKVGAVAGQAPTNASAAATLFARMLSVDRVMRHGDVRADTALESAGRQLGVRSCLAAPVVSRQNVIHGGLLFGHVDPNRFTEQDAMTIRGVAIQAGIAIDNAQLLEQSQQAQYQLQQLNDNLEQQVTQRTAELHRSERQFQQLVAGVTDYAIYMIDVDGTIVSWNPGAERIKGYQASEIIGKHFEQFYTDADRAAAVPQRTLETAARRGKFEGEAWRVRKDGTHFWASVLIDPIRDSNGKLIGFAKVTRDMTVHRAMQEQLHQSQKMEAIGQLTGGVAHDFNNLLTVILGNLDAIWRHLPPGDTRLRRAVDQASHGAQRAATLTQQLLAFARRQPLNPKPTDVNRLVADMSDLLRRTLGENIAVETVLADGLWRVDVDSHQLESALLNLAVNSRDAMSNGGKLTIETANAHLDDDTSEFSEIAPGQYVVICVTDTGAGIPRDVLNHVFEPFFTTKPIGHGTGLGLSQVYGFVKQSGGHIKLYSEEGQGTTAKIYLPRLVDVGAEAEPPRTLIVPEGRPEETILVVEDDDDVRIYSTESLRELKFTVLEASSAESALRLIEQHPEIQLLFTDVGLPGANGRQLVEIARKRRPGLKVLFTTGYARNAIMHQGRLDTGVELLTKPFTRAQLATRVRDVLDAPPIHGEERRCALVAEDEELVRMFLVAALEDLDYRVVQAASAASALKAAATSKLAVAIIDIGLPDRSGLDVAHELRKQLPSLPIVMASGYGSGQLGSLSNDELVAYLPKPFDEHAIATALEQLGLHQASRASVT